MLISTCFQKAAKAKTRVKKLIRGELYCSGYIAEEGDRAELTIFQDYLEALKIERPVDNSFPLHRIPGAMAMEQVELEGQESETETLFYPSSSSP